MHGAIAQFMGQATSFAPKGPCYRCLVPKLPQRIPSPAQTGVIGAVAGTIGTLQAVEVIKWLLDSPDLLSGRLIVYDGWKMTFTEINILQNPLCPDCGSVE
jgi:adenylyltransferase/sulfurtransferase